MLDLPRLYAWAADMQGRFEGGFRGRTCKLVDGCYSYWVGALFPLLRRHVDLLQGQWAARARPQRPPVGSVGWGSGGKGGGGKLEAAVEKLAVVVE